MNRLIYFFRHSGRYQFYKVAALGTALFLLGSASVSAQYCSSNATSTADEDILNVTFGTLNNSSTCSSLAPGTGSILNEYSNYTALTPPNITAGSVVPLSVQVGTCGGNYSNIVGVFIDYNRDNTFDITERVYASTASTVGPHIESANIIIPTTISYGTTRMRVINIETSTISSLIGCASYTWGETEDYTVNLIPAGPPACISAPLTPANASTTACAGNTLLSWNAKAGATGYNVYLDPGTGTPTTLIGNNIPDTFISVTTTIPAGPYTWKVIPKNSTGVATGCSNFTFTSANGLVAGATVKTEPDSVICPYQLVKFTATPIGGGATPSYQWKKNNVNVGINSNIYTDDNLSNNDKVRVVVTTSATSGCITAPTGSSNTTTITWKPTSPNTIASSGRTGFCTGGSVMLSVPTGATAYQWRRNGVNISTNSTSPTYTAIYSGTYIALITGSNGCSIKSDSQVVTSFDPPVALLARNGNVISTSTYYATYQWYKNGAIIPNETTSSYTFTTDGRYSVGVTDTIGCVGSSSYLYVNNLAIGNTNSTPQVSIYPNPAANIVRIDAAVPVNVRINSMDGKEVMARNGVNEINIGSLSNGIYMIYVADKNNQTITIQKLVKGSK